ncbi:hypothetical protein [Streptomyces sp. NBC_01013]|uniref:hypothetical protein n=1 Tax=Streptomyces sp. NBC_01013 TaxID=2903718 RepID=UPI00386AD4A0|nr:hypothetical protein OG538_00105 [Streptomyces sp. NBC_01013]
MTRRWFISSAEVGAAADATSVTGSRPSFSPAVRITRAIKDQSVETFPDRPGPALQLLGPGDTIGFDRAVVVREEPPPGCPNSPANYLAHVEFSDASLPWLLSFPAVRKLPWLALLVLRDNEGDLKQGGPLPIVEASGTALPDLADAWAWAHVEARVEDAETPEGAVTRDVRSGVDNVVARLICPRDLDPDRGWLACVVPATKAGIAAGLGDTPPPDGNAPAWSPGQAQARLPVYHWWRFRTGSEGSFEELARKVAPVEGDSLEGFGARTVDVRHPWPHKDVLEGVAPAQVTVPVHGALRLPHTDTAKEVWSHEASMNKFRGLIVEHLDAPAARRQPDRVGMPPDRDEKAVAAPLYGSHHTGAQQVPGAGWMNELNTQVKYRIAAAIGARYVQLEQEFLMARAWEQVGQVNEANQALAASELAAEAARAAQAKHLDLMRTAPLTELSSLYRDVIEAEEEGTGGQPVASLLRHSAVPDGVATTAFVRLTRPGGALRRRSSRAMEVAAVAAQAPAGVPAGGVRAPDTEPFLSRALDASKVSLPSTWLAGVEREAILPAGEVVHGPMAASEARAGDPSAEFASQTLNDVLFGLWMVAVDFCEKGIDTPMFEEFGNPRQELEALFVKKQERERPGEPRPAARPGALRGIRRKISVEKRATPLLAAAGLGMTSGTLVKRIRRVIRPVPQCMGHMTSRLGQVVMGERTDQDARPLRPIMTHPEFGFPIAAELLTRWPEWAVPGISAFPDNSSTLLEPNPAFVEAMLVGLNQEFNRELRWREYPTDEAGTPFSRFWPPGGTQPGYGEIARWGLDGKLGDHGPDRGTNLLFLLIRGEVLQRYPGTVVLAAKSVDRKVEGPDDTWKKPRFVLPVDERTNVYGFADLTAPQAVAEHWMFVMREPMRGAQFGFDVRTPKSPAFDSWPNLTWDEVPTVNGFVIPRVLAGAEGRRPPALGPGQDPPGWEGLDASNFARILFQRPFQLAFSASAMVGEPPA